MSKLTFQSTYNRVQLVIWVKGCEINYSITIPGVIEDVTYTVLNMNM